MPRYAWFQENFPACDPDRHRGAIARIGELTPDRPLWKDRVLAQGWGAPTWPKRYGGGGLSGGQARAPADEMARIGAYNPIGGMGISMFRPTLLEYGTDARLETCVPDITGGRVRRCQGFSEPGAGSDLAALQTRG